MQSPDLVPVKMVRPVHCGGVSSKLVGVEEEQTGGEIAELNPRKSDKVLDVSASFGSERIEYSTTKFWLNAPASR